MEKIIAPISNPDEIREESQKAQAAQLEASQVASQNYAAPTVDVSEIYPPANSSVVKTAQAIPLEKPKPLIGVYIIGVLVILVSIGSGFSSHGNTFILVVSVIQGLLGIGLLMKNELARMIYVIFGILSLFLNGIGTIGAFGASAATGTNHIPTSVLLTRFATLLLTFIMVVYLSSKHVKAQFG